MHTGEELEAPSAQAERVGGATVHPATPESPIAAESTLGFRPSAWSGLGLFLLAFSLYVVASLLLVTRLGLPGLVAVQLVCLLLPGVWLIKSMGLRPQVFPVATLPQPQHLEVPLLLGVSVWYFLLVIALPLQQLVLPVPEQFLAERAEFFSPDGSLLSWVGVGLAGALCPAVCEEVFFRGVLLPCCRATWSDLTSVVVVSLLFALFHFNPYQLSVTFLQGLILGLLLIWSGTLFAPMLFHFLNNAMVILISALMPEADPTQALPAWGLLVAALPLGAGVALLVKDVRARRNGPIAPLKENLS